MFKRSFKSKLVLPMAGAALFSACATLSDTVAVEPIDGVRVAAAAPLQPVASAPKKEDSKEKFREFVQKYPDVKKCDEGNPEIGKNEKVVESKRLSSTLGISDLCIHTIQRDVSSLPNIAYDGTGTHVLPQAISLNPGYRFDQAGFSFSIKEPWISFGAAELKLPINYADILVKEGVGKQNVVYGSAWQTTMFNASAKRETIDVYFYPKETGKNELISCKDSKQNSVSCAIVCKVEVSENTIDSEKSSCVFRYLVGDEKIRDRVFASN